MPLAEFAVRVDGEWRVLNAGRPVDMIAFEDQFGKPAPDAEGGQLWRQLTWLAHRIDAPAEPFDAWLARVDELTADPEAIAEVKRELAGEPPAPADLGEPEANGAGHEDADPFASAVEGTGADG